MAKEFYEKHVEQPPRPSWGGWAGPVKPGDEISPWQEVALRDWEDAEV